MATRLMSVVVDAADPRRLAGFWAAALDWLIVVDEPDGVAVDAGLAVDWGDGGAPRLTFVPVAEPKRGKNRMHVDLPTPTPQAQRDTVDRLLGLGASRVDIGQGQVPWEVLADPEGNELCVLEPREDYAYTTGVAAVVLDCHDPQGLAAFWSQATGWPPADDGPHVALQHPLQPAATRFELLASEQSKQGSDRLRLDVAPRPGEDLAGAVARLEAAGARRVDLGQGAVPWAVLADPEGNEFCVLSPR